MSNIRRRIIFLNLSLVFCLSISQVVIGDLKTNPKTSVQEKAKAVKKSTATKQKPSRMSCPYPVNDKVAKGLVADWMQAEMWGQTRSTLVKPSCLERKTKYRLSLPGPPTDVQDPITPLLANKWQLLQLKKAGENKFSTDYRAKIQITGKLKNKSSTFSQEVLFAFPKGMEAKLFGCVMLHSSWEKEFITKECLK